MAEQNEDFVSFEKALRDLKMQSEELKKLVSEGEIRAFRDGQSMKFKREDVESLAHRGGEEELVFDADLEDDTGMVTEELTDEETLLAEDDLLDEEPAVATPSRRRVATTTSSRRAREEQESQKEPALFTAGAILCALVGLWGLMISFSIAAEQPPKMSMFTSLWAK